MTSTDRYETFADRYDIFAEDPASRDFYREQFAKNDIGSVLDCACGTGRDLVTFHRLGCKVVGSDISPSMLRVARERLQSEGIDAALHELDFRKLPAHFDQEFDCVACLGGSLLECADEAAMLSGLHSMYAVLREGGLLVLTQGITDKLWRERPRFILEVNNSDISRLFVVDYRNHGACFNVLDIFHTPDRNGLEIWSMEQRHILFSDNYRRLLEQVGFSTVDLFGGYNFEPYDTRTSDRLIVLARK